MKRLFFGLFAAAVAIGGSAFTNATPKQHFASFYYVLTSAGTYVRTVTTPQSENCENTAKNSCWMEFSDDKGASFTSNNIPTTNLVEQSPNAGLYEQ